MIFLTYINVLKIKILNSDIFSSQLIHLIYQPKPQKNLKERERERVWCWMGLFGRRDKKSEGFGDSQLKILGWLYNNDQTARTLIGYEVELEQLSESGLLEKYQSRYRGTNKTTSAYKLTPKGRKLTKKIMGRIEASFDKDTGLVGKVSAFIFLLAGLFFMALPEFTATGNVIGNSSGGNISFFLSLALMIIGGVLLFNGLKK